MKSRKSIVCLVLFLLALDSAGGHWSQQPQVGGTQTPNKSRVFVPRVPIQLQGPISFEEFSPAPGSRVRVTNEYEQARGIVFNPEVDVLEYPDRFAHTGTKAITRCWGVEVSCDGRFVMAFLKPQRRVKIWFGFSRAVERPYDVVLRLFTSADASGTSVAEASAPLPVSDGPVKVDFPLEATSPKADIFSATVGLRNADTGPSELVIDDIEFDVPAQSDLTFESLQAQVMPDLQLVITAVVKNNGPSSSAATTLELTESRFWDTPASTDVPPLDPGAISVLSLRTTLSARPRPGQYPYTVVIDPKRTISDADPLNNSREGRFEISLGKPDFSVKLLNSGVNQYQAFVIAEIKNVGRVSSPATIATLELDGIAIGTAAVKSLAPEESVEVNLVTDQKPPRGQHSFVVKVNYDESVDESDLTNNSVTGLIMVRDRWCEDPIPCVIGIVLVVITLTGVTVAVNKRIKRRRARRNEQRPEQPPVTSPIFTACPKVDSGVQQLDLSDPGRPSIAVRLRPRTGESLQEIFDRPGPTPRGET